MEAVMRSWCLREHKMQGNERKAVPPAGFEPATCALGMRCSVHLSYEGDLGRRLSCRHAS